MYRFSIDEVFFASDTHFKHRGILRYQANRKFDTVEDMNEALISNWNEVVPVGATVIHAGDFAFASKNRIREFRERLNGKIILLKGNHDHFKDVEGIFEVVKSDLTFMVGDQKIHAMHYPMASWEDAEEGSWMLHGHYHGDPVDSTMYKRMDIGVDTHPRLRPYSYYEVHEYMSTRTDTPLRHARGVR